MSQSSITAKSCCRSQYNCVVLLILLAVVKDHTLIPRCGCKIKSGSDQREQNLVLTHLQFLMGNKEP